MPVRSTEDTHEKAASSKAPAGVALILNPRSGVTRQCSPNAIRSALVAAGIHPRVFIIRRDSGPIAAARTAIREGATTLIAAGGDGTISAVASVAIEAGATLGILPAGTLNHFARDLGIPLHLEEAARVLSGGYTEQVDVAEVNGRIFLNNSSLGLYPRIAFWRERQRRLGRSRTLSLLWATLRALWRMPIVNVKLNVNGAEFQRASPLVLIGNNTYELHGTQAGTRASLTEGHLSLYIAKVTTRIGVVRLCLRSLLGGLRQDSEMEFLSVSEAWMHTRRKQLRVALDGEVIVLHSPMHYRSRPGALRVLVPQEDSRSHPRPSV